MPPRRFNAGRVSRPSGLSAALVSLLLTLTLVPQSLAQPPVPEAGPVFDELVLEGASVFSTDDVVWLLRLRRGQPLPGPPEKVAELLQNRYVRDGYVAARVEAVYDPASQRLTLRVDEGRIDDIEFQGLPPGLVERFREGLNVAPGDLYNRRAVRESLRDLLKVADGALEIAARGIELVPRNGRRVLVIPIEQRRGRFHLSFGTEGREDFFSPVDGFTPGISLDATRFDPRRFRHTFVAGHLSYKFAREDPGYSFGIAQPLLPAAAITLGFEVHDLTTSDDLWRLSSTEQSLVALGFGNSFRDYYRRRGAQVFGALRPRANHELVASLRRDRHETLENETDFSLFRRDHSFRPSPPVDGGRIRALVFAYTWDSRGVGDTLSPESFARHLIDDLFRANRRQAFGGRVDWTSEVAGHGLGGDYEFDRHILNARAYLPVSPRQSVAARALRGFSGGALPVERRFALGGIGTVRGYAFKEAVGEDMTLVNLEYRLDLSGGWHRPSGGALRAFLFYDAGRIRRPVGASRTDWLQGTGLGVQTGPLRVEFGFRLDDIPRSRQILVRLSPDF